MPDVKMNYESMKRMEKAFHQGHQQVNDTMAEMKKIAQTMEEGALLGLAGQAYAAAIKEKLVPRLQVIAEKLKELEGDIHGAELATREGVATAQSRFK